MNAKDVRLSLFDWLAPLFELPVRLYPEAPSWNGHIPFLFLLISLMRPRTYVELGVHRGTSFLAACEAVKRFETDTHCYGIDTWMGDAHTQFYQGDEMYEELRRFILVRYSSCELIRTTFDKALDRFDKNAIDLLHIDGLHTYEAVSHDFENWATKLSDRSIVMFHDTEVRERDFGVWKFWSEVKQRYKFLEFYHSHGLGVLFTGRAASNDLDSFLQQLHSQNRNVELLQSVCEAAGTILPLRMQRREIASRQAIAPLSAKPQMQAKIGRNAPCPCGSGRRYKHCHGRIA